MQWGMPQLKQLVAVLRLQQPVFDPRPVHVGFVVEKVALIEGFSPRDSVSAPVPFHKCSIFIQSPFTDAIQS